MSEIIVDLNGFMAEYSIYYTEGAETKKIGSCNIDSLYEIVPQFCREYSANKIHLFGQNVSFVQGIADGLTNTKEYSNFNIEVEIN